MPRKKKIELVALSGSTLMDWKKDSRMVEWAQKDPRFQLVLTVLMNEMSTAVIRTESESENRLLGIREGYDAALDVLKEMKIGWREETPPEDEMVYENEMERDTVFDTL